MNRSKLSWCAGVLSLAFLLLGSNAHAVTRPYCTGSSATGYTWWNWTDTNQDVACGIVLKKILGAGHAVNRAVWGSYDTNTRYTGRLICNQGQRDVIGTGGDVFENGLNMRSQLGWTNCVLRVQ
jgi:hypothetical protein